MKNIIAVEGIVGSGKSTLIAEITKRGYQVIPELSTEIHKQFPPFSIKTDEAITINKWFFQQEVRRCAEAMRLAQDSPVIADRWYHSIFAVSYARNILFGTKDTDSLASELKRLKEQGLIFTPNLIIIDVPLNLALERLERRYGSAGLMERLKITSPHLLEKEQEYYRRLTEPIQIMVDGRLNAKGLADKVIQYFK